MVVPVGHRLWERPDSFEYMHHDYHEHSGSRSSAIEPGGNDIASHVKLNGFLAQVW